MPAEGEATTGGAAGEVAAGGGEAPVLNLFPNQLPNQLAAELEEAAAVGARAIRFGDEGFEALVNEGTVKFIITESRELVVIGHTVRGVEISHAVAAGGRPVLAAGEAEIAGASGRFFGINITPHSGHYFNSVSAEACARALEIAKNVFRGHGISF